MENELAVCTGGSPSRSEDISQRKCWVCLGTDDDIDDEFEGDKDWVSPCRCRGSLKWVHQFCIKLYIYQEFEQYGFYDYQCNFCNTPFYVDYEEPNNFVQTLERIGNISERYCDYMDIGLKICNLFVCTTTYGAIMMMQLMGKEEAISIFKNTNPFLLILMLPIIPISLVAFESIKSDTILRYLSRFSRFLRRLPPLPDYDSIPYQMDDYGPTSSIIISAFTIPTVAMVVGKLLFFKSSLSNFKKVLLGGFIYMVVKRSFGIYLNYQYDKIEDSKRVSDYHENVRSDDQEN